MNENTLSVVSSLASILSFFISVATLLFVRSVKQSIVERKKKTRFHTLIRQVLDIPTDALPLSPASKTILESLKRNIKIPPHYFSNEKWDTAKDVHTKIVKLINEQKEENICDLKETINDYLSYEDEYE